MEHRGSASSSGRAPRHARPLAAAARARDGLGRARCRRRPGPDESRRTPRGSGRGSAGPTIVCAQAGNVNTGAFDPFTPIAEACEAAATPGCTSTARSACGLPPALASSTSVAGSRRGLLGDRRPQVAERALRLRRRLLPASGSPRGRDGGGCELSPARRRTEPVRTGCRSRPAAHAGFAVWAALRALGRNGGRGAGRPLLRPRARLRVRPRCGGRRRDPERRRPQPVSSCASTTTTRRPERWSAVFRPTAPAGSAGPTGRAAPQCGSRFRASGRRRETSSDPRQPS